jgi:erythromycin esterase-like protein
VTTNAAGLSVAGWTFDPDDAAGLASAFSALLTARSHQPEVLAFGEPTHGEPAFPALRNRIFAALTEHGFRSIAIESDAVSGLIVDRYVRGGETDLDATMSDGFSHRFGPLAVNRELVTWMRAYNDSKPPDARLAFYGFDAPLEMTEAPSPRPYLERVHTYLTGTLGRSAVTHSWEILDSLLGDEERWNNPAALMDAAQSIGASPEAKALRAVADDVLTALHAHAPDLIARSSRDDWYAAQRHGRTALGLLRYHAAAAHAAPAAERTSWMLAVRDVLMAENLLGVREQERLRGPTLAFAHNRHLQRHPSTWRLGEMDLRWLSGGAIVAALLGDRYTFIAGTLGASASLPVRPPAEGTFEAAFERATSGGCGLFDGNRLREINWLKDLKVRTDAGPNEGYFPLDHDTIESCDGLIHIQ